MNRLAACYNPYLFSVHSYTHLLPARGAAACSAFLDGGEVSGALPSVEQEPVVSCLVDAPLLAVLASLLSLWLLMLAKSGVMLGQSGERVVAGRLVVHGFVFGGDAGFKFSTDGIMCFLTGQFLSCEVSLGGFSLLLPHDDDLAITVEEKVWKAITKPDELQVYSNSCPNGESKAGSLYAS